MYFSNKDLRLGILYNILTYVAVFFIRLIAFFNKKLKLGVNGRKQTFEKLENAINPSDKCMWFHCSSLGEYEQGLPVFQKLKREFPNLKIVLSFFSPSGYEVRKTSDLADVVVYLPFDTISNAKRFVQTIHPELVVFVKYEIWPNYLQLLRKQKIPALLISALLRQDQIYFKWYGGFMRQALFSFDRIFTQDESSKKLLEGFNFMQASVSGDTRFDRVSNQLTIDNSLDFVEQFKEDNLCLVAGSTWKEDIDLLIPFINSSNSKGLKTIIAPHNINTKDISSLKQRITKKVMLYSEINKQDLSLYNVLILDTIGVLAKVYNYADIAYVGGAMGNTGLHNTLEAAVFGIPIIIGKNYSKFPEAIEMIKQKGMVSVSNSHDFETHILEMITNEDFRLSAGKKNSSYIKNNEGAVIQIIDYIRKYIIINA